MADETKSVFKSLPNESYFQWKHIPYMERIQWNNLLHKVVQIDARMEPDLTSNTGLKKAIDFIVDSRSGETLDKPLDGTIPTFYNQDFCLALTLCPEVKRKNSDPLPVDTGTGKPTKASPISKVFQREASEDGVILPDRVCWDVASEQNGPVNDLYPYALKPYFNYHRQAINIYSYSNGNPTEKKPNPIPGYDLQSLTVGSLVWLYFYERMGIFKILGVLLDDYNYRGKYSLSSQIKNGELKNKQYVELLEHLSILTRQGLASTLRDRVSTYQRVLGVTIQNDLNIQSAENGSFMKNFSKLISNMLEYFNAKRLAMAIQNQNSGMQVRSSVATQTAILNTIKVLSQNLEVMEYGRNMIHTFTGIATVYVTLCLIRQIRDVIGIPREYDTPEEYVPAAYDILVLKKQGSPSDSNRYTVFDDCASYGYRILTDVQLAQLGNIRLGESNTEFDAWLSNVEEWVEGYNNAFKSIPDKTNSETAVATV